MADKTLHDAMMEALNATSVPGTALTSEHVRALRRKLTGHALKPDADGMIEMPVFPDSALGRLIQESPEKGLYLLAYLNSGGRRG